MPQPLRERGGDIPQLVHHFVGRFAQELNVPERWPTEATLEVLERHSWPGNVRELENVIKRALVLASGDVITPADIESAMDLFRTKSADWTQLARRDYARLLDTGAKPGVRGHYWKFVERLEHSIISEALTRSRGNQLQAASLLGINRNTLRKKISELGIDVS